MCSTEECLLTLNSSVAARCIKVHNQIHIPQMGPKKALVAAASVPAAFNPCPLESCGLHPRDSEKRNDKDPRVPLGFPKKER